MHWCSGSISLFVFQLLCLNDYTYVFIWAWQRQFPPSLTWIIFQRCFTSSFRMHDSSSVKFSGRTYLARNVGWCSIFSHRDWIGYNYIFFVLQQYFWNLYFWFGVTFKWYTTSIYKLTFNQTSMLLDGWILEATSFYNMFIF